MKNYIKFTFDNKEFVAVVKRRDVVTLFNLILEEDKKKCFDKDNIMRFLVELSIAGRAHMDYFRGDLYARTITADKPTFKIDCSSYDSKDEFYDDNEAYYLFKEAYYEIY